MSRSTESISTGLNVSTKNPQLFMPAIVPMAIQMLFQFLAYVVFPTRYYFGILLPEIVVPNPLLLWGGYFIASIVGFIVSCMIVDMAYDVLNGRSINFSKSLGIVTGRLGTLIVAAIISAICFITFFLIPVALFIVTIAMIEGTDAVESTKKAFGFVSQNLGEVIVFIIIVIVVAIVLGLGFGFIPVVGTYIGVIASWIANVIFTTASVQFYLSLRASGRAPPPPPPPPPPT